MGKLLHREDLEQMECACGGDECDNSSIVLRSACHSNVPTWTFYDKREHCLIVICAKCEEVVTKIKVAYKKAESLN